MTVNGVERRLYPRIPLKDVLVDTHSNFDRSHDMLVGKIEDISMGGMLTVFDPFDQLNEQVFLSFSLPNGSRFVGIKSRVVWSGVDEDKQLAGMEFLELGSPHRSRLADFIQQWESHFEKHGKYPNS